MSDIIFSTLLAALWVGTITSMVFAIYDGLKSSKKWDDKSFILLSIIFACVLLALGCSLHFAINRLRTL